MSYVTPHLMTRSTGSRLSRTFPSASTNPAKIHGHSRVSLWLSHDFLQVVIPSSKLKTRITSTSPKTKCSTNTRIYVCTLPSHQSTMSPTYDSAGRGPRHCSWNWTLMTNNFVLCWLPPLYLQERESIEERSKVHHSERET